ncbi:hypothetical protein CF319_g2607 [Tilletia indica]|uniref:Kinetochore protein NUF2 n=2 Tax=Tilletia TaxID=13289 RepID=A0A8X7NDJ9_9BASI|nr:hypothetical protein CF327_g4348 [Tilletia walkeri]KAE8224513.1 hypothetical protein CF319_g2607 [Tilletia indica]KAE8231790.1 hypothetical protein CF326_g3187 [Tilletia indica]KAE8241408.1 hypothetical protein A4X13_0g7427 [Tilletia indica]KAE8270515.1 hypothetical protein A4X09_0g1823 [Tilletia walkeri]
MANASTSLNPGQLAASAAQDSHTSFPIVKNSEILQVLGELGLAVTADDIARPTLAVTMKCFIAFLDALSGTSSEWLEERARMVNQLDYKEIYPDGLYWRLFYRDIYTLLVLSEVRDFAYSDITRPQTKRFKRQLSALINFWRFRSDRVHEFEEIANEETERENTRIEKRQLEEMKALRVSALRAQREAERDTALQLRNQNGGFQAELVQLKVVQKKLLEDLDVAKKEKADAIQKLTDESYQMALVTTEIRKLNGRIISSPKKLKGSLNHLQQQLVNDKAELIAEERRSRALESKRDVLMGLETEMKACNALLETLDDERSRIVELRAERDKIQDRIEQYQTEIGDAEAKRAQYIRQSQSAEDRLQRLHKGYDEKRSAYQAKMEAAVAALHDLNQRKTELMEKAKAKNLETADLEAEFDRMQEDYKNFQNERMQERNAICHLAEVYIVGICRAREIPIDT